MSVHIAPVGPTWKAHVFSVKLVGRTQEITICHVEILKRSSSSIVVLSLIYE
jgi:hypothetical protein